MLQTRCRNCLILWSPFSDCSQAQKCRAAKGCGLGSGILGAHWPQQHVCFHASFIHFITSLDECDGVEEKPCYPATEREEPHSIFSSSGPAFLSACSLQTWITLLQGVCVWGGVGGCCHMSSSTHGLPWEVPGCEEKWESKAGNCIQMAQLWCPFLKCLFLCLYTSGLLCLSIAVWGSFFIWDFELYISK